MSELQLGLIGLGAAVVVTVLGYNRWQAYQHRRTAEKMLQQEHEDVLLRNEDSGVRTAAAGIPARDGATDGQRVPQAPFSAADAPAARNEPVLRTNSAPGSISAAPPIPSAPSAPVKSLEKAAEAAAHTAASSTPTPTPTPSPSVPSSSAASGGFIARTAQALRGKGTADKEEAPARVEPVLFPTPPARLLSSAVDYLAAFELSERVSGSSILDSQREALAGIGKRISWVGVGERTRDWETVEAGSDYRRLYVGLQLADRRGPLGEADLVAFQNAMQALAGDLKAVLNLPPRNDALTAAIALDHFCADVDIQIGINVVSRKQPFTGTQIRRLAEAAGMRFEERGDEGFFFRYGSEGYPLYFCGNREKPAFAEEAIEIMTTNAIFFLLDVPCVADGEQAFARMLAEARRFAGALGGELADDNYRSLSETQLGPIRLQIVQKQAAMAERDLPAGGPLALRLFS